MEMGRSINIGVVDGINEVAREKTLDGESRNEGQHITGRMTIGINGVIRFYASFISEQAAPTDETSDPKRINARNTQNWNNNYDQTVVFNVSLHRW